MEMLGDLAKNLASFESAPNTDYPRFQAEMDKHGYDWEAKTVTTEDDYILTTFHVLGRTGVERTGES